MIFLLDQGLPRSTVTHLASAGVSAQHVGLLGMATASDHQILDLARQSKSVVVTLDADFHRLLAASNANVPSVVRIRMQGLKGNDRAQRRGADRKRLPSPSARQRPGRCPNNPHPIKLHSPRVALF